MACHFRFRARGVSLENGSLALQRCDVESVALMVASGVMDDRVEARLLELPDRR